VAGGTYAVLVRDGEGGVASAEVTVPSGMLEVVLGTMASAKRR
jgi:hypothetical protein